MIKIVEWITEKEPVYKNGTMVSPGIGHFEVKENSKVTWEELKEKAKEMGMLIVGANSMLKEHIWVTANLCFYEGGNIVFDDVDVESRYIVSSDRTPEQMLAIMKALK